MKMRKILEKRATKLKAKLSNLEERAKKPDTTRDELTDIETQVEDVTAELEEIADAIAELPDEDAAELEDVVDDLGAAVTDVEDETVELTDEVPIDVASTEEARSRVLNIIGEGLSSRGETVKKKLNKRAGFLRFLAGRINASQARSLGVGFNNGKVLVPEELSKEIITYLQDENPLRKFATVHPTKGTQGFPVQIKKAEANTVINERDENDLIPFTDVEFDDVFLNPIEFDAIIKVTKKLTHMSDFDIEAIVIEELQKAYLRKETFWYFSNPLNTGNLSAKAVTFVPKVGTTNNYLKLIQLKNALPTAMRGNARWMINRAAQTELESMLDNTGNPILKDSGNDDFEFKLFTYPVEVTDYADKYDATGKVFKPEVPMIYFGNFAFFHIQDVINTMELEPLRELFARENKVGFKIYHLNDGQLIYGPFETPVYFLDFTPTPAPEGE
ncbi:phage major capsid protein [Carnobacterium maltaromaticum]|uniref:phage major capsid protein n=1 Tax=Carnobacterium maltaromaticum TaxID=2751 RepID=UPI00191B9745|nr:phage major capsid protein [Carnobacterium maltaromaticum]CAD5902439.1 Phage major capsid protein, HK97 family [Carnobacterium maltaromaticum]